MNDKSLLRSRSRLAASLPSSALILRGSLLERRIRHRSRCTACAEGGPGHLVWVLAVSYPGGRVKHISLRPDQKPLVEQWLQNYRDLKDSLEQICEINQQLVLAERNSR